MKTLAFLLTASVIMLGLGACAGAPKKETASCCAAGSNMKDCPAGDPHCAAKPKKQ